MQSLKSSLKTTKGTHKSNSNSKNIEEKTLTLLGSVLVASGKATTEHLGEKKQIEERVS